jgi:hypothetical protein
MMYKSFYLWRTSTNVDWLSVWLCKSFSCR